MVKINLLPWRLYQRLHIRRFFKKILVYNLVVVIAVLVSARFFLIGEETDLQWRVRKLQREVKKYTVHPLKKTSSPSLSRNIKSHPLLKDLLIKLNSTNAAVCFANIDGSENKIKFTGRVRSAMDLTEFLLHWQAANLFSQIKIHSLEQHESGWINFNFQAVQAAA